MALPRQNLLFNLLSLLLLLASLLERASPFHYGRPHVVTRRRIQPLRADAEPAANQDAEPAANQEDWRDFRARLIAREKEEDAGAETDSSEGWAYETPLAETGVVILGGTEGFGFGLNQQYFHKSVILVLQHDKQFTRGVILNRPTGVKLATEDSDETFDVWFGGDVCGLLSDEMQREITCLHALPTEDRTVERLSFPVVRGISYTSLEGAEELVRLGLAKASDFWVFVGYAGWGPGQLQGELDRKSWHLAAADSSNLLRRMLERDETSQTDVGMSTWADLMNAIGRADYSEDDAFDDEMLREWSRVNLDSDEEDESLPEEEEEEEEEEVAAVTDAEEEQAEKGGAVVASPSSDDGDFPQCENVEPRKRARRNKMATKDLTGFVLRSGVPSQYILQAQYMHKGVLVILADKPEMSIGVVVNRPSSSVVQFRSTGQERRINLGGEQQLGSVQMLVFHASPDLAAASKSQRVGDSGLWQIGVSEADALMQNKDLNVTCADFLAVSGVKVWMGSELKEAVAAGALDIIQNPAASVPWTDIIALGAVDAFSDAERLEEGTNIWKKLSALESPSVSKEDKKREELADMALSKFAEVFLSTDDE